MQNKVARADRRAGPCGARPSGWRTARPAGTLMGAGAAEVDSEPVLRLATRADEPAIDGLMKASTAALFPAFYDARQTASSIDYIAHVDPMLIDDETYFVIEA